MELEELNIIYKYIYCIELYKFGRVPLSHTRKVCEVKLINIYNIQKSV